MKSNLHAIVGTGMATIRMTASDNDSYIQYYAVSTDGGNTYSELLEWPRPDQWDISAPEYTFTFQLPFDTAVELRTMAYNEYDKFTESNTIGVGTIEDPERLRQEMQQQKAEELLEKQQTYTEVTAEAFVSHTDPVSAAKPTRIFHRNHGFDCRNCTSDADSAYGVGRETCVDYYDIKSENKYGLDQLMQQINRKGQPCIF